MSAAQFKNPAVGADRRRRLLVVDLEPAESSTSEDPQANQIFESRNNAAFPMLSRDRLIRRIMSPRLWKHVTVAIVLTLSPIVFAVLTWPALTSRVSMESTAVASRIDALRGLSGLELFAAAQFCLLIGWVRSASAVDFRGGYRWWRSAAIGLFIASIVVLTGTGTFISDVVASLLEPMLGRIDAARPALTIVPSGLGMALVLRRLIPDMGRCRMTQSLLVISTGLVIVRAVAVTRMQSETAVLQVSALDLLISGLVLSALQLHARFVIHVNPNPPGIVQRKFRVTDLAVETAPTAIRRNDERQDINCDPILNPSNTATDLVPVEIADVKISNVATEETYERHIDVQQPDLTGIAESPSDTTIDDKFQPKSKSGKKQKYRKAG